MLDLMDMFRQQWCLVESALVFPFLLARMKQRPDVVYWWTRVVPTANWITTVQFQVAKRPRPQPIVVVSPVVCKSANCSQLNYLTNDGVFEYKCLHNLVQPEQAVYSGYTQKVDIFWITADWYPLVFTVMWVYEWITTTNLRLGMGASYNKHYYQAPFATMSLVHQWWTIPQSHHWIDHRPKACVTMTERWDVGPSSSWSSA